MARSGRTDYRSTAARARRLASALAAEGLGPDSFAGSLAWNTHRHLELFYGVSGIGAALHTANPRLAPEQHCLHHQFHRLPHPVHRPGYARPGRADPAQTGTCRALRRHGRPRPDAHHQPAERDLLRRPDRRWRRSLRLAHAGRTHGLRPVLHLRHHRRAEGRAVQPSRHRAVGAVHRRRQRLGAVGRRRDPGAAGLLSLQRLGHSVLRSDVRRQAGDARASHGHRIPARADRLDEGITVGPGVPTIWLDDAGTLPAYRPRSRPPEPPVHRRHRAAGDNDRGLLARSRRAHPSMPGA